MKDRLSIIISQRKKKKEKAITSISGSLIKGAVSSLDYKSSKRGAQGLKDGPSDPTVARQH